MLILKFNLTVIIDEKESRKIKTYKKTKCYTLDQSKINANTPHKII